MLHHCCVVCTPEVYKCLSQNFNVTGFWFNPNIFPQEERDKRLDALVTYSKEKEFELLIEKDCPSVRWPDENEPARCEFCYTLRLSKCAEQAKKLDIKYFSTTLLSSPHQKHELIKNIGQKIGEEMNVEFVYNDFRSMFYRGKDEIWKRKLYMQKYCGCQFSTKTPKINHEDTK